MDNVASASTTLTPRTLWHCLDEDNGEFDVDRFLLYKRKERRKQELMEYDQLLDDYRRRMTLSHSKTKNKQNVQQLKDGEGDLLVPTLYHIGKKNNDKIINNSKWQ